MSDTKAKMSAMIYFHATYFQKGGHKYEYIGTFNQQMQLDGMQKVVTFSLHHYNMKDERVFLFWNINNRRFLHV